MQNKIHPLRTCHRAGTQRNLPFRASEIALRWNICSANVKCPLARTWANFISHRARRDISQCAGAHYFTFCGSKTFHYMHLCLQMQCLSRKKDEEFLQFFVLFLLVGILIFILLYRRAPSRREPLVPSLVRSTYGVQKDIWRARRISTRCVIKTQR